MDIKAGNPYPSGALSNFAPQSFNIDGIHCASMEGFLQSLKFKNPDMQIEVCSMVGAKAKRYGANKNWQRTQTLWWRGVAMERKSLEYQQLLDKAFMLKFSQNTKARNALLATNKANLTHSIGRTKQNETVLTKQEFCSRLHSIRNYLQLQTVLEF